MQRRAYATVTIRILLVDWVLLVSGYTEDNLILSRLLTSFLLETPIGFGGFL